MEQQEEINQQAKPEQKKISLKLIGCLGLISIVGFLAIVMLWVCPLPVPSDNASTTKTGVSNPPSPSDKTTTGRIDVATLLDKPKYDTEVSIYGKVTLPTDAKSPYFELSAGGKKVNVWYDSMVEDNGKKRAAVSVKGIQNGDWVVVTGELKKEGKHRALNDFWASSIKKLG